MELKVWVEGIQRIVCGVNEKTTCQDVVFALAHATGKTGRFTLIERWRNSERLLAPNEQPLKVLLKWGEHSNDVQFILQWSPLDASNSSNKSGQPQSTKSQTLGGLESSCSDNSSSHSPSPLSKLNNPYNGPPNSVGSANGSVLSPLSQANCSGINKQSNSDSSSYNSNSSESRFVGLYSPNGHDRLTSSIVTPENQQNGETLKLSSSVSGIIRGAPQRVISNDTVIQSSNGKGLDNGPQSVQSLGKLRDVKLSSPPPYREPPSPVSHPTPPLISSSPGMSSPSMKSLPPYRDPPPPNLQPPYIQKTSSGNSPVSDSNLSSYQPPVFNVASVSGVPINSNGVINGGFGGINHKDASRFSTGISQQDSLSSASSGNDTSENWKKKDHPLINGDIPSNLNGSVTKQSSLSNPQNPISPYKDLIRMVNSQREKLTSQQAELTQYDAEIMFWEGKAREQQRHVELITKEISRLEVVSSQQESQVVSLAHLEEENEYAHRESAVLKSEINSLRTELEKCDSEIEQCKKRIRLLMEELHTTQTQMSQRQEEWMQKEASTLAEIDRLRRELELARRETEAVNDLSGSLDQEVQSIEASLSEKKKQMERLVSAMKEANLQSLSIQPPEELIEAHHRSGSTRRMIGSPRQLENAAPTSKNPHGVWV